MEEIYWRQFWETGKVTDYLAYREKGNKEYNPESEELRESDYSDRHGAAGITYR